MTRDPRSFSISVIIECLSSLPIPTPRQPLVVGRLYGISSEVNTPKRNVDSRELIQTADRGPGVDAQRRGEFLQAEPGAALICAHLKGYAFAQDVDRQL